MNDASGLSEQKNVIVFAGAKGGVGTTFLAANVAVALATAGARTVLVDLDLQYGDAHVMLNIRPDKTLGDLIPVLDEVTIEDAHLVLIAHPSGLSFLAAPAESEQAELITPYHIKRLLLVMSQNFDAVIVNTKVGLNAAVYAALESASEIFLATTAELTSVIATRRFLNVLAKLSFPLENISIALNQVGAHNGLPGEEVAKILAPCGVRAEIAFDDPAVAQSINSGSPVVVGASIEAANGINAIAAGIFPFEFKKAQPGLLAKLLG